MFPDVIDPQTRKLVRAVSGKTYRPDTLMKAIQWQANRRLMLQSSRKQATKDMDKYFKKREEKERKAELRDQLIREAKEARENGANLSDEDDAPMVATSKSTAPISRNRAGQERLQSSNKQTTVTSGDDDDSDAIVVATTKI